MGNTYYTFVSVNGKSIRVEQTETEHEAQIRRLRAIERKRAQEERDRAIGLHRGVSFICKGCGRQIPSTYQTRTGDFACKFCGYAGPKYNRGPRV